MAAPLAVDALLPALLYPSISALLSTSGQQKTRRFFKGSSNADDQGFMHTGEKPGLR